ncbi:hypothetical protein E7T06_06135 [Deinococcus sp. Arct2-2]|uniref:hypothetical protein n=1 Tax=Deinococcus sp. Arct2-2 TaxID=2568653 RepID=UPI0010A4470C|nr:hypothetical protein [Deinococcus sp. Arct2-2]THF70714.1 hypothetical protein E7T06_06135 [Deinococcus sp. Arct2-2]
MNFTAPSILASDFEGLLKALDAHLAHDVLALRNRYLHTRLQGAEQVGLATLYKARMQRLAELHESLALVTLEFQLQQEVDEGPQAGEDLDINNDIPLF